MLHLVQVRHAKNGQNRQITGKINHACASCEYLLLKALQCNFSKCIGAMISFHQQTITFLSTCALNKLSLKLSDLQKGPGASQHVCGICSGSLVSFNIPKTCTWGLLVIKLPLRVTHICE